MERHAQRVRAAGTDWPDADAWHAYRLGSRWRAALIVEIAQKFLSQGTPSSLHMVAERCLSAAVDLETHDLLD